MRERVRRQLQGLEPDPSAVRDVHRLAMMCAIPGAVSVHTRATILNTPYNPTGKIYPSQTLERLAALLTEASERYGRPV